MPGSNEHSSIQPDRAASRDSRTLSDLLTSALIVLLITVASTSLVQASTMILAPSTAYALNPPGAQDSMNGTEPNGLGGNENMGDSEDSEDSNNDSGDSGNSNDSGNSGNSDDSSNGDVVTTDLGNEAKPKTNNGTTLEEILSTDVYLAGKCENKIRGERFRRHSAKFCEKSEFDALGLTPEGDKYNAGICEGQERGREPSDSAMPEVQGDGAGDVITPEECEKDENKEQQDNLEAASWKGVLFDYADNDCVKIGRVSISCIVSTTMMSSIEGFYVNFLKPGLEGAEGGMAAGMLGLPDISGELQTKYDSVLKVVQPGIMVAILLLGLSLLVRSANTSFSYASQYGLGKIFLVAIVMGFFPQIMSALSDFSGVITASLIENGDYTGAINSLVPAPTLVTGGLQSFNLAILLIFMVIALIMIFILIIMLFILKIIFIVLFMLGPIALLLYLVPGLSNVTEGWFRAILGCMFVSVLLGAQMMVATIVIGGQESLLGMPGWATSWNNIFAVMIALVFLYMMIKTPMMTIRYAFNSFGGMPSPGQAMYKAAHFGRNALGIAAALGIGGAAGAAASGGKNKAGLSSKNLSDQTKRNEGRVSLSPGKAGRMTDTARKEAPGLYSDTQRNAPGPGENTDKAIGDLIDEQREQDSYHAEKGQELHKAMPEYSAEEWASHSQSAAELGQQQSTQDNFDKVMKGNGVNSNHEPSNNGPSKNGSSDTEELAHMTAQHYGDNSEDPNIKNDSKGNSLGNTASLKANRDKARVAHTKAQSNLTNAEQKHARKQNASSKFKNHMSNARQISTNAQAGRSQPPRIVQRAEATASLKEQRAATLTATANNMANSTDPNQQAKAQTLTQKAQELSNKATAHRAMATAMKTGSYTEAQKEQLATQAATGSAGIVSGASKAKPEMDRADIARNAVQNFRKKNAANLDASQTTLDQARQVASSKQSALDSATQKHDNALSSRSSGYLKYSQDMMGHVKGNQSSQNEMREILTRGADVAQQEKNIYNSSNPSHKEVENVEANRASYNKDLDQYTSKLSREVYGSDAQQGTQQSFKDLIQQSVDMAQNQKTPSDPGSNPILKQLINESRYSDSKGKKS